MTDTTRSRRRTQSRLCRTALTRFSSLAISPNDKPEPAGEWALARVAAHQTRSRHVTDLPTNHPIELSVARITVDELLRLPTLGASDLDEAVAAANLRRLDDAIATIATTFRPADPIVGTHPVTEPSTIEAVDLPTAGELGDLVDHMLVHEDMRPPHLGFDVEGTDAHDRIDLRTAYDLLRPDVPEIASKILAGGAVVLRWVDDHHSGLSVLCEAIETVTGTPAGAEVLMCGAGLRTVPGSPSPSDRLLATLDSPATCAVGNHVAELHTGKALVLPAGCTPILEAPQGGTFLLLEVRRVADADLVDMASASTRFYPLLRADVPVMPHRPAESYEGNVHESPAGYASQVRTAMGPDSFERAAALMRAMVMPRSRQTLGSVMPDRLPDETQVRSPAPGGVLMATDAGRPAIGVGGLRMLLPERILAAVAAMLDGRPVSAVTIRRALGGPSPEADAVLNDLLRLEVLDVVGSQVDEVGET